jgi:hypothetical protein
MSSSRTLIGAAVAVLVLAAVMVAAAMVVSASGRTTADGTPLPARCGGGAVHLIAGRLC